MSKNINLLDDEKIIAEVEAELWATSPNFIFRLIANIIRIIALILGMRKRAHVIITNKRIIEISEEIRCYCFIVNRDINYLTPSAVQSVGYSKAKTCCLCCSVYHIYYGRINYQRSLKVKTSNEEDVRCVVDTIYNLISK